MRTRPILSVCAACLLPLAANACVGDPPPIATTPHGDGDGGQTNPPERGDAGGGGGGGGGDGGAPFCETVAPAIGPKETVFCDDFEGPIDANWQTSSENGTLATSDFEGSKVLDVTMNAVADGDYAGPRLLWRKIPAGGTAEVSFDFMLVEAPEPSGDGLVWFGRIGGIGAPTLGFGSQIRNATIHHVAIFGASLGEEASDTTFTFAPRTWTRTTIRYASKTNGADLRVSVGNNQPYVVEASGAVSLIEGDIVFLGAFVKGTSSTVRARFDNVVIRVTAL